MVDIKKYQKAITSMTNRLLAEAASEARSELPIERDYILINDNLCSENWYLVADDVVMGIEQYWVGAEVTKTTVRIKPLDDYFEQNMVCADDFLETLKKYRKGFTLPQIAKETRMKIEDLEKVIAKAEEAEKFKMTFKTSKV